MQVEHTSNTHQVDPSCVESTCLCLNYLEKVRPFQTRWLSTLTQPAQPLEVYVGSVGHGVQWDIVTEYHVVPVHRSMCKYTIILSSPCATEHRVPLNPSIPLSLFPFLIRARVKILNSRSEGSRGKRRWTKKKVKELPGGRRKSVRRGVRRRPGRGGGRVLVTAAHGKAWRLLYHPRAHIPSACPVTAARTWYKGLRV